MPVWSAYNLCLQMALQNVPSLLPQAYARNLTLPGHFDPDFFSKEWCLPKRLVAIRHLIAKITLRTSTHTNSTDFCRKGIRWSHWQNYRWQKFIYQYDLSCPGCVQVIWSTTPPVEYWDEIRVVTIKILCTVCTVILPALYSHYMDKLCDVGFLWRWITSCKL